MSKNEKNLAQSIGLEQVNTETAIDEIAFDILFKMYKTSPKPFAEEMKEIEATLPKDLTAEQRAAELKSYEEYTEERTNEKVRKVFGEWTGGSEWSDGVTEVSAMMLLGPPGQGKTTSFKEAAKKVASALNLTMRVNPADDVVVGKKDFMFLSQECSGENQATTFAGIPVKVSDEKGIEYMSKLMNKRFVTAKHCGGALLLLDDFPNAAPAIQNIGLSLTEENRFQGLNLENVYIGITGNLGSLDGTHTTRLSTALRGRCKIYYTEDALPNWVDRIQRQYRDELGDAGVVGFLKREPQYFAEMPNTRHQGGFSSPRTWDKFVRNARVAIVKAGGRGRGEQKAIPEIKRLASSHLGLEVGLKIHAYYHSLMVGADPIARKLVIDGQWDEKGFKERFGNGYSADNQFFAYQFAIAMADYAVQELVAAKPYPDDLLKSPKHKQIIERFGKGIMAVNDDSFSFALDHFKTKLANQVEQWSHKVENRWNLKTDVKKALARIISTSDEMNFTEDKRKVMSAALSDADKFRQSYKSH